MLARCPENGVPIARFNGSPAQLRNAVWTGDTRDTRAISDISALGQVGWKSRTGFDQFLCLFILFPLSTFVRIGCKRDY